MAESNVRTNLFAASCVQRSLFLSPSLKSVEYQGVPSLPELRNRKIKCKGKPGFQDCAKHGGTGFVEQSIQILLSQMT